MIEKKPLNNLINVETIFYLYFIICVVETFTNRSGEYKKPVKKKTNRVHTLKNNKANSYNKIVYLYINFTLLYQTILHTLGTSLREMTRNYNILFTIASKK